MRLLILSDSHRYMDFMERCIEAVSYTHLTLPTNSLV